MKNLRNKIFITSIMIFLTGCYDPFDLTRNDIISAGTSATVDASGSGGGMAFTKLNRIDVGAGATFHVGSGTTLIMNVLNVF